MSNFRIPLGIALTCVLPAAALLLVPADQLARAAGNGFCCFYYNAGTTPSGYGGRCGPGYACKNSTSIDGIRQSEVAAVFGYEACRFVQDLAANCEGGPPVVCRTTHTFAGWNCTGPSFTTRYTVPGCGGEILTHCEAVGTEFSSVELPADNTFVLAY